MVLWGCIVVGLVLGGWGILSTQRMLHPARRAVGPPPAFSPPQTVFLVSPDGQPFDCWFLEAQAPRGVLIACHGYRANRLQVWDVAHGLCQRGYCLLLFDLRGHGTREGPCTFGIKEREDLGVLLSWIRQQPTLAALPVGLLGFSLGGAVACQAAMQFPQIKVLVLDSTYARLFPILALSIRKGYHLSTVPWAWITWIGAQLALGHRLSPLDPVAVAPHARVPLLVIHGTADQTVPVEHARSLVEAWQGPKECWLEAGAGHVQTCFGNLPTYCDRVAAFFDRWLNAHVHSSAS